MNKALYRELVAELRLETEALNRQATSTLTLEALDERENAMRLQRLASIREMNDTIRLLHYVDPSEIPDNLAPNVERLSQQIRQRRADSIPAIDTEFDHVLEHIKENVRELIHPMVVVGKWPPDTPTSGSR